MRLQIRNGLILAVLVGTQLSAGTPSVTWARVEDPALSYTLHFFSDVDGVDVYSHYSSTGIRMNNDIALSLQWGHDVVVFPAIDAPPGSQEAVDAITTASRPIGRNSDPYEDFVKVRDEFQATAAYRRARATYYVSTESDYFAQMVTLNYNHGFMTDNLNISVGASYAWDNIQPLEDNDTAGTPDFRRTLHGNVIVTQILTPTTVVRFGGEFNRVRGLQHDPYRNVYVAGTNVPELHPKERDRWVGFLNVSQYITNRSSVQVDYRYYEDDWDVSSHTIGGRLNQYITDAVVMRYRYRYYTQGPAFFFREDYTIAGGVNGFHTGDYRLGDYGAHLFGGRILWYPHRALGKLGFLQHAQLVFSYEHYFNDYNFSANIYETGFQITF